MSRRKGANAELEVSKMLQKWWAQHDFECIFARTPGSGGWGTQHTRHGMRLSGDLATTSLSFPWAVEVKRREGWSLDTFMKGLRSPVWTWWRQAQTQAEEMNLSPMLWLRHSQEPWVVVMNKVWEKKLSDEWSRVKEGLPRYLWPDGRLIGLGLGEEPCMVHATSLLAMSPKVFAK